MLEGFTKDELFEMSEECLKKYEKLEVETLKKALTGEIGTNNKMIEELEKLNRRYKNEMSDFEPYTFDLNPSTIENFKKAEEYGQNVIQVARELLEMFDFAFEDTNKLVFVNEDGQVSDEYGNPLNEDGEHSVFETIKGGAEDREVRNTLFNPAPLGVIKGGK